MLVMGKWDQWSNLKLSSSVLNMHKYKQINPRKCCVRNLQIFQPGRIAPNEATLGL